MGTGNPYSNSSYIYPPSALPAASSYSGTSVQPVQSNTPPVTLRREQPGTISLSPRANWIGTLSQSATSQTPQAQQDTRKNEFSFYSLDPTERAHVVQAFKRIQENKIAADVVFGQNAEGTKTTLTIVPTQDAARRETVLADPKVRAIRPEDREAVNNLLVAMDETSPQPIKIKAERIPGKYEFRITFSSKDSHKTIVDNILAQFPDALKEQLPSERRSNPASPSSPSADNPSATRQSYRPDALSNQPLTIIPGLGGNPPDTRETTRDKDLLDASSTSDSAAVPLAAYY